jgi:alpha-tubulin suppressor-like RCC1 family protein/phosphodiesterase/alkaline phosphatase D-like protein
LCWGSNYNRYLFEDIRDNIVTTPTKVSLPNNEKIQSISAGHAYSNCALAESGRAYCWGEHHLGNYFTPTSRTPVLVEFPNDMRVTEVQSGASLGCATSVAGDLWCWGDIDTLGTAETEPTRTPIKVSMPDGGTITSFNVGITTTCVVTSHANAYCWGDNSSGEMGLGYATRDPFRLPTRVTLPGGAVIALFALGLHRTCALDTNGGGWCWGDNYEGSFGNNSYTDNPTPQKILVPNNEPLATLSTGWYHTCALTTSGAPWCWGSGDWGRLGTGTTLGGKTFRQPLLPAGTQLTTIAAGLSTSCALDTHGNAWCWGGGTTGMNGSGSLTTNLFPVRIAAVGTPSVAISSIGNIGADSIVVNSAFNGNGKKTTIQLQYSTNASFSESRITTVSGITRDGLYTSVSGSSVITQLEPRTTYYIRVVGTNSFGSNASAPVSVTTIGSEPTVSTPTSSNITGNEARISANIHPGLLSTSVTLHIDTQSHFPNMTSYNMGTVSGSNSQSLDYSLSGLTANSSYYVRVEATNKLGTTTSTTSVVTTGGHTPTADITSSSSTITSITSQITIATGDTKGSVLLQASESNDFSSITSSQTSTFSSSGPSQHSLTISQLSVATTYWIRAVVTNDVSTTQSDAVQVRTAGSAPLLTLPVVTADTTSARITSTINTTGLTSFATLSVSTQSDMSNATQYFMYSGNHSNNHDLTGSLSGLLQRTTYYATVTAKNSLGTTTTGVASFRLAIPIGVAINDDSATTESLNVTLGITLPDSAVAVRISNSPEFTQAKVFERIASLQWTLDASNTESRSTVWVQFFDALGRATTYSDAITVSTSTPGTNPTSEKQLVGGVFALDSATTLHARRTVALPSSVRKAGVSKVQTKLGKKIITHKVKKMKNGTYTFSFVSKKGTVQMRLINKNGKPGKWQTMRVA